MFETTVGTHKLDRDGIVDTELTQQFTPIFQALLTRALGGGSTSTTRPPAEDDFHRDPLAAPLPTQLSTSPAETVPPSSLDAALLSALPLAATQTPPAASSDPAAPSDPADSAASSVDLERTRLHAVPVATGGAHRAEPPARTRATRRAARSGAHRAPEVELQQPDADRPATGRGGRHRTLRAVVH